MLICAIAAGLSILTFGMSGMIEMYLLSPLLNPLLEYLREIPNFCRISTSGSSAWGMFILIGVFYPLIYIPVLIICRKFLKGKKLYIISLPIYYVLLSILTAYLMCTN